MPTVGPNNYVNGLDDVTIGVVPWTTPGRASVCDTVTADCAVLIAQDSHGLLLTKPILGIPPTATIVGVTISITRIASALVVTDELVSLYSAGALIGMNKADLVTIWPGALTVATYGGAADLWGAVLTPAICNDNGFGLEIQVQSGDVVGGVASIDCAVITVTYTLPLPPVEVVTYEPFPAE